MFTESQAYGLLYPHPRPSPKGRGVLNSSSSPSPRGRRGWGMRDARGCFISRITLIYKLSPERLSGVTFWAVGVWDC